MQPESTEDDTKERIIRTKQARTSEEKGKVINNEGPRMNVVYQRKGKMCCVIMEKRDKISSLLITLS